MDVKELLKAELLNVKHEYWDKLRELKKSRSQVRSIHAQLGTMKKTYDVYMKVYKQSDQYKQFGELTFLEFKKIFFPKKKKNK